jgi:hypothetical protein
MDRTPVRITYSGTGGVQRTLDLVMPSANAKFFAESLKTLLTMVPNTGSAAHWRWACSCIHATGEKGGAGKLRHTEIRAVMQCANASARLSSKAIDEALQSTVMSEQEHEVPAWLRAVPSGGHENRLLNTRQVSGMLLRLCTSSQPIQAVFGRYAVDGRMTGVGWIEFVRAEQLTPIDHEFESPARVGNPDQEVSNAEEAFARALANGHLPHAALSPLHFALELLSSQNNAVLPTRDSDSTDDLHQPLAHYWTACSHNSYVVGDQLTGVSTADAYKRQLLQASTGSARVWIPPVR